MRAHEFPPHFAAFCRILSTAGIQRPRSSTRGGGGTPPFKELIPISPTRAPTHGAPPPQIPAKAGICGGGELRIADRRLRIAGHPRPAAGAPVRHSRTLPRHSREGGNLRARI